MIRTILILIFFIFISQANAEMVNKLIIEGVNIVKKHKKPDSNNPQGGIVEKEAPLDISNVSLVTSEGKPTRVGFRIEDGIKVRYSKKTDELI